MSTDANSVITLSTNGATKNFLVVIILGGGIVGTSLAAMLSATGYVQVILIDPAKVGHGISSTNHGRAHIGTWNPPSDTEEAIRIIQRNEESQRLLDRLPNVWESNRHGLYCTASPEGTTEFKQFLAKVQKEREFHLAPDAHVVKSWIDPNQFSCFQVPEASFSPASLAGRLHDYATATRRCDHIKDYADRLERRGSSFYIRLASGEEVRGDVVVNCLGGWHNELQSDLDIWRPKLVYNNWRLMAFNSDAVRQERLDRVITIDRSHTGSARSEGPLAAIPHGAWVVFGKDLVASPMRSQDEVPPGEDWRTIDLRDRMDGELFESHAEYFPILKHLYDARNMKAIFSFPGVYPEVWSTDAVERSITGVPTPYRVKTSWVESGVPGCMSLLGGSATSALANAKDACASILTKHDLNAADKEEWIERIAAGIPKHGNPSMIWDYHRAPFIRMAA
jgi:glycine/D-amino acid oxidase-like deaminating enzyme